ncbi:DoxX family membrane protein [Nesterenkonia alba]|uniref:DoxX family membrane protein n=1 Tax=Nesterenkonia alba TaxID=515814 RepID=UPI0003B7A52F|nr:DoxX family membrane protein [Nesterenkonia alba]
MAADAAVRTAPPTETTGRVHSAAWYILAVVRILIGFEFLWAFLDKTFGLHFYTPPGQAWINGVSPTYGYLSAERALDWLYQPLAEMWIVEVLFMAGLLGVGIGLMAGVAVRISAIAGAAMLLLMWTAAFPIEANPFVNYNLINAVIVLVFPFILAHQKLSLAEPWQRLTAKAHWLH